jgi:malate dehydrogenase (oxaloacetate-decarboxylating)(NADP+)
MTPITKKAALAYHRLNGIPGKIEIIPSKPLETQQDLGLAYTPGVAYPVLEIDRDPDLAYEYTSKGNLVAVVSNGTAILGLGNLGALASKPVMEGKSVLFKKLGNLDSIDIEVDSEDPETVIEVTARIAKTFGGINLEDIRSPECFHIERELQRRLDIPVFHDDQHGTAIILGAALLNSLEITGKKVDEVKVVFSGAGAAALGSAALLLQLGVPSENMWMCDVDGLVYKGRKKGMFPEKERFANGEHPANLAQVLEGADMFIGLSVGKIVTPEILKRMGRRPVIFAMANPDPEISFEEAKAARPDAIVGTGRSDYPNQVNNVLGFPYIFRGALDVRARAINDQMKLAASHALADLTKEPISPSVLQAYGLSSLEFGPDYVIPKPIDSRLILWESPAVAKAAIETGAARVEINLSQYRKKLEERVHTLETRISK